MLLDPRPLSGRLLPLLAGVLVLKVTASVVANYPDYLSPNFSSDFLRGREPHFAGAYQWAFTTHILSAPVSLILGLILVGERFRLRFPRGHRALGRVQVACVLFLVTPSGLWMARYAAAGPVAGAALASLAMATALCVILGFKAAIERRLSQHRRWMWRCYLLLCSAVVLRLIGGLATVAGSTASWVDPLATRISWLVPLSIFECREWARRWPGGFRADLPTALVTQQKPSHDPGRSEFVAADVFTH